MFRVTVNGFVCLPLLAFVERLAFEAEGETSPLAHAKSHSELRNKNDVHAERSPGKETGAEMPPFCPKQFNPAVKTAALEMQGTF